MKGKLHFSRKFSSGAIRAKNVVFVDGCRIPFTLAGTTYNNYLAVDLGRFAMKGLLTKTAIDPKLIDYIIFGNVIQEARTSNIAKEASMGAGIPNHVSSHTVAQACISSNQAITSGVEKILAGQAEIVLAGGTETFSDVPIRFSKPIRQRLLQLPKVSKKGPLAMLGLLKGLGLKDLAPEAPAIANYTTGEVMGVSSDRLAARFDVSRRDQDQYSVISHQRAAKAHADGLYVDELIAVDGKVEENGIKGDTTYEKMSKLSPAFVKPHGTHTAANSSFLTDGASACLIMSEEKAMQLGLTPKALIKAWTYVAQDPFEEMLLGPTFAAHKVLHLAGLTLADIDVIEMHEAFAGQVLANLTAMASESFAKERLPGGKPVGRVDMEKMNKQGGSLALGHPFGATGTRLVTTAANRLIREDGKYALLMACADGGLAHACIIEKYVAKK
eukprot:gene4117-8188_t